MAHYVMADLHGDADRFRAMLAKIEFSPDDVLFIIGDAVDRGPDGAALLQEIRETPNIRMLLGNHEDMMRRCFSEGADEKRVSHWMRNGGGATARQFLTLPEEEQMDILMWICTLPTQVELRVKGQHFLLVHGWPADDDYHRVWGRPKSLTETSDLVPEGTRLIIGHTPVGLLVCGAEQEEDAFPRILEETGEPAKILHTPGYIDMDCGCGYHMPGICLACLRLEDMAEFYV